MRQISTATIPLMVTLIVLAGHAGAADCFTPEEARAAHLRALQQQFTVAALNCRTVDAQPGDPTFSGRYNSFVGKFEAVLAENAKILRLHFKHAGGDLDRWMTKVANAAGQRVVTDVAFCQSAWEHMDSTLAVQPEQVEEFAASTLAADPYAPACPAPRKHEKPALVKVSQAPHNATE